MRTNQGFERAARCAEELQRLSHDRTNFKEEEEEEEENWISLVQRVKRERLTILNRARGLVRTIEDLEQNHQISEHHHFLRLCNDIQSLSNQIDTLIEEKVTTPEIHDLHIRCLEARARVLLKISKHDEESKIIESGLDAGLARIAASENSPQSQSLNHISKAVDWLRASAQRLKKKQNEEQYRDSQLRVLISLGDA